MGEERQQLRELGACANAQCAALVQHLRSLSRALTQPASVAASETRDPRKQTLLEASKRLLSALARLLEPLALSGRSERDALAAVRDALRPLVGATRDGIVHAIREANAR